MSVKQKNIDIIIYFLTLQLQLMFMFWVMEGFVLLHLVADEVE